MNKLRSAIIFTTVLFLSGCLGHLSYDFFEPNGSGKVMSDMGGGQDATHLEYIRFDQGNEIIWIFSNYVGYGKITTPTPCIGVTVAPVASAPSVDAEEVSQYLQRALSIQIDGKSYAPLRVRVMPGWERRFEAYVDFFPAPQPINQFTLRFELRSGEARLISFTRKHADYWYAKNIQ